MKVIVRSVVVALAVVWSGIALAQTQTQKPNFSGTWVAISGSKEAIGQEISIKHDATSITLSHGGDVSHGETYRLDGKETEQADLAHPSEKNKAQAKWDGDKIVITVWYQDGRPHKRVLTMQADGTMLLELNATMPDKTEHSVKVVHKKK